MEWHELIVAAFAAIATTPLAFFFPECQCCGESCGVADGKPRTDPVNEGTWVPSGTWRGAGGVTWTFAPNPGDDSGETWFFYGSVSTSKVGGGATIAERQDWGNICNWYSNKTTSPSTTSGLPGAFDKRANRLPPETAIVHVYSRVSTTTTGPRIVKNIYFWGANGDLLAGSEITSTASAHDSTGGAVFSGNFVPENFGTINGGATFNDSQNQLGGIVNGSGTFNGGSRNFGTTNGGGTFFDSSTSDGVVNDGATFNNSGGNGGTVNGGAIFYNITANSGVVNGGASFYDNAFNEGVVNDSAVFNDNSGNVFGLASGTVNGGAVFYDDSTNTGATVNGGAVFNNNSTNGINGTVNGGATFNDASCSERTVGNFFAVPCSRKFVAHPTDLPTCNGTAPDGCANSADTCGCG